MFVFKILFLSYLHTHRGAQAHNPEIESHVPPTTPPRRPFKISNEKEDTQPGKYLSPEGELHSRHTAAIHAPKSGSGQPSPTGTWHGKGRDTDRRARR